MHADNPKDTSCIGSIDERNLFHGTESLDVCHGICTNSFDFRTSGKNATLYGEGSYFARDARYSHNYTSASNEGGRYMFRAKVLVGNFTQGHSSLRRPPEIPGQGHKLYDSCVDNKFNPTINILFDRNQSYPEYLINYRKVHVPKVSIAQSQSNICISKTTSSVSQVNFEPVLNVSQPGTITSTSQSQNNTIASKSSPITVQVQFSSPCPFQTQQLQPPKAASNFHDRTTMSSYKLASQSPIDVQALSTSTLQMASSNSNVTPMKTILSPHDSIGTIRQRRFHSDDKSSTSKTNVVAGSNRRENRFRSNVSSQQLDEYSNIAKCTNVSSSTSSHSLAISTPVSSLNSDAILTCTTTSTKVQPNHPFLVKHNLHLFVLV
ncbi:PARP7S [Mytilus coruscus]|uniref:Poly [ADP-ribose] polymerase n=1 Tax=Mytilus coruscus TaxID=42192 RepID=A0A6J8CC81_MYTCO|nr:PARP7S [Mytilus coruscus]